MINKIILAIALCFLGNNLIAQIGGNQRGLRNQQGLNPVNERIEPNKDTPPDVNVLSQEKADFYQEMICLLYTSPSPRDQRGSRMPSSA